MKFSIVIPIYNLQDCLTETLRSVERQTFRDFECICVDDGSCDGSGGILDEFAARDGRIKAVHVSNGGVCRARNRGLDEANGDWIVFLDGDDVLHSRALEVLACGIKKHADADLLLMEKWMFDGTLTEPDVLAPVQYERCDVSARIGPSVFYRLFWQGCYRRTVFGDLRMDSDIRYNMGEDDVYYCQALERARKVVTIGASLYGYRQRAGSAMHTHKSIEKWHYDLLHYRKCFQIMNSSGKQYDKVVFKDLGLRLTEGLVPFVAEMTHEEREQMWKELVPLYREVATMRRFPFWIRLSMWCLAVSKSRMVYFVLVTIPRWLKFHVVYYKKHFRGSRCTGTEDRRAVERT